MPLSSTADFHVREVYEPAERGLFASRDFAVGEAIYKLDYWSEEVMPMHVTNHSCDANAAFDTDGMLVALREISAGTEITFNYPATPLPASPWNFKCNCQSANCVGWIYVIG